jgi:NAD(P)-dependent dehydrogenase (short-subunit alcohol dehydrogenase family)
METPVALVTGGLSGIGQAVASLLVDGGWRVHVMGRSAQPGFQATDGVTAWRGDVRSADEVTDVVARVVAAAGRLDALVCCAGIAASGPFESQPAGDLDDLLRTNVLGTMLACQAALPHLKVTRGSIALIGSTLADHPRPMTSAYAATKGALDSLAKALAVEYGPQGVRVNCVRPSMVRTDLMLKSGMTPESYQAALAARAQTYPLRRVGAPEDVARMVRFLLSNESAWTTGVIVDVDGGHSAAGS